MNRVGEKIKAILQAQKMAQAELCKLTSISESAMSKYLNGDLIPRTEVLISISKALNVSLNTLLGIKEDNGSAYSTCKKALLARSGKKLTDEQKKELVNLILGD